jgi:hypothetical protein
MALAALLLLPFLNTPFTIDDPLYLREAGQVLTDPLHPQAFDVVWSTDLNLRASQILPGGILVPYLLVPTALLDYAEWAGHLTQLLLLLAAIYATACAALRLGLNRRQATAAAILTAACPAVLGMANTVMPDIPAMLFTILGLERIIVWRESAWRDGRRWHQAMLATLWLTCAALTRTHTLIALAPACIFLLDGITPAEIRASFKRFPARFLPVLLTPVLFFLASAITADPEPGGENILLAMTSLPGGIRLVVENGCAFLAHWLLVIPLTLPWILLRPRQRMQKFLLAGLLAASVLSLRVGWVAFPAIASLIVLLDILLDAIKRHDRIQLALWVWLLLAAPVIFYIQLPSKYLLPSVPAAAILVVRLIPEARRETVRWLFPAMAAAEVILGLLIVLGVRDLAQTQRQAVESLVKPRIAMGQHVWFAGHWGFQWYAEKTAARAVTRRPPLPQPGDIIVVSLADHPRFAQEWTFRTVLDRVPYTGDGIGRVMDLPAGVGFFSSSFGYLPWAPGAGEATRFEVWKVE